MAPYSSVPGIWILASARGVAGKPPRSGRYILGGDIVEDLICNPSEDHGTVMLGAQVTELIPVLGLPGPTGLAWR